MYIVTLKNKKNNKLSCRLFSSRKRAEKYLNRLLTKKNQKKIVDKVNRMGMTDSVLYKQFLGYNQIKKAFYLIDEDLAKELFSKAIYKK